MIRTVLVAACVLLSGACLLRHAGGDAPKNAPQIDPGKIHVFVTTAPPQSRAANGDELRRQRTTALLADALKGKKGVALVTSAPQADVVVYVHSAASLFVPHAGTKFDENAIPVDVRAIGQTVRFVESGYDSTRTAGSVAKDIHRWIQANGSKIVAARPPAR